MKRDTLIDTTIGVVFIGVSVWMLLAWATLKRAEVAPPPYSVFPVLPPYLDAPAGRIPIGKADSLQEKQGAIGVSDYLKRTVILDARLSRNTAWLTIEHERCHFILFDAGVQMDETIEEWACDAIAAARVAEMLR